MSGYGAGEPGGPADWYACGGCLSVIAVEWIAVRSIGDDGWGMSSTGAVRLPGAAVTPVIERLRERLASGESQRGLEELYAHANAAWLTKHPEVLLAAVPLFRGHALASRHLSLSVTRMSTGFAGDPLLPHWRVNTWLHAPDVDDAAPTLIRMLGTAEEIVLPAIDRSTNDTALLRQGAHLEVRGADGPYVCIRPAATWEGAALTHLKALLEQVTLDPDR